VTTLNGAAIVRLVRQPRPRAQRWILWIVLALLTSAPVFLCQATSSSDHAQAVVATAHCDGGHDVQCSRGPAVSLGASTRSGRDGEPELLLVALVVAVLGFVRHLPSSASRAPRRPTSGRLQLVALGIARI
jgi:hypothetical protein